MRKLTVLLIAVLFVASIVIVGVFGLNAVPVEERYPVKEINFVDYVDEQGVEHYYKYDGTELVKNTQNGKTIYSVILRFGNREEIDIPIVYNINPTNATVKTLDVNVIASSSASCYQLSTNVIGGHSVKLKRVAGLAGCSVTLQLKAADGSDVKAEIRITAVV